MEEAHLGHLPEHGTAAFEAGAAGEAFALSVTADGFFEWVGVALVLGRVNLEVGEGEVGEGAGAEWWGSRAGWF